MNVQGGIPQTPAWIRRSPWSANDLLLLVGTWFIGAVVIAVAYGVASGRGRYQDQVGMVSLATAGVALAFGGQAIWLLRGQRAVGERCEDLLPTEEIGVAHYRAVAHSATLVAGEGLSLYHRA